MTYQGRPIEIIGVEWVFGKEVLNIRMVDDNTCRKVYREDLDKEADGDMLARVRYKAIAARINEEVAQKRLLAPYENSLIPLPHQILALEKVMKATETRFLMADEVGMGKTIEAGLVLKEKKLRGEVKRVLLVVPKSAMLQWQAEMKTHFGESFFIYESSLISSLARTFSQLDAEEELNFWRQHNQIIVSTDALKPMEYHQGWSQEKVDEYNKYRLESVLNADFDMLIIDEAHRMGGATAQVGRYQLANALCNTVANVLLLSATPHRGKSDHFRRILQLIDNDAFQGEGMPAIKEIEPYIVRSEKRYAIDNKGQKLFNERTTVRMDVPIEESLNGLQKALYKDVTNYVKLNFGRAKRSGRTALGLVMIMFQKMASSSTAAILSAMRTRLFRLENGLYEDGCELYEQSDMVEDGILDEEEINLEEIGSPTTIKAEDEKECLRKLIAEAEHCMDCEEDAKATALKKKIRQLEIEEDDKDLKIVVFTEFRTTQRYVRKVLEEADIQCTAIDGSMSLDERQQALVDFKERCRVMVATDAAGESLNMQFCHIAINYDLPWNPMAIEQRIGRVDRIGQKHPVLAINMLPNNSVDVRVYDIIIEKLDRILQELGIDKTSDVLDSTIDNRKITHLHLQSLLDPLLFSHQSEQWLYEIKQKLQEYKSTAGALPVTDPKEITAKSAADVKYSPLPVWLESLLDQYVLSNGGFFDKRSDGTTLYSLGGQKLRVTFDSNLMGDDPSVDLISLQHPMVKNVLNSIFGEEAKKMTVLCSTDMSETPGVFSLWMVNANNSQESRVSFVAQFVADNGQNYTAYANDIWTSLVQSPNHFVVTGEAEKPANLFEQVQNNLYGQYCRMEAAIVNNLHEKADNKLKAISYAIRRVERIGIENIRKSRLKRLEQEKQEWKELFDKNSNVVPGVKLIMTVRIDG